jgi:N-acetylglucosamine kinase-like BadF-type ATPase
MDGAFEELETVLNEFIPAALKDAGATVDDIAHAVLGLAGVDTSIQHKVISGMLLRIGFKDFTLCNDAFLGVPAGCPGGAGICAINGTGSSMAAIDRAGATVQICGIGPLSNDCGGSGWYAAQVLGAVYGELFKLEPPTALRSLLFEAVGVTRKEDYVEILTSGLADDTLNYNAFNQLAFTAAGQGDEIALGILRESAEHYAGGIAYLASELDFPDDETLYVTLAGSVFVKEKVDILPRLIESRVRDLLGSRPVQYVKLDVPPVAGAVLWAAQKAGAAIDGDAVRTGLADASL